MSGFAIEGGQLFSGLFPLQNTNKHNGSSPFHRHHSDDNDAVSFSPFSKHNALKLYGPKKDAPHGAEKTASTPAAAVQPAVPDAFAADQILSGYAKFLQDLHLENGNPVNAQNISQKAEQLIHVVTAPLGISEDDIQELHIRSDYSLAQVFAEGVSQDENGANAAVVAGRKASAHLQADIVTKDGRHIHIDAALSAETEFAAVAHQDAPDTASTGSDNTPADNSNAYAALGLLANAQSRISVLSTLVPVTPHAKDDDNKSVQARQITAQFFQYLAEQAQVNDVHRELSTDA